MRVIGVSTPVGSPTVDFRIGHGQHPAEVLFERGFVPLQPLAVTMPDDEIVFTYLVRSCCSRDGHPRRRHVVHDAPLDGEEPVTRQRVGAYAVVFSSEGLLGTVNSDRTPAPGTWALPGGGVDAGESPSEAVVREVYEESGQHIRLDRVLALESEHWLGRSPSGVLEDFHALRIIYGATCETPSPPVVHDHGGSTERASWVPWRSWRKLRWTISSRTTLARYGGQLAGQSLK